MDNFKDKLPEDFLEVMKEGEPIKEDNFLTHFFLKSGDVVKFISESFTFYIKIENIVNGKLSLKRQNSLIVGPAVFFGNNYELAGDIALELPIYINGKRYINYSSIDLEKVEIPEKTISEIYIYKKSKGLSIIGKIKKLIFKKK